MLSLVLFCALAAALELDDTFVAQFSISSPFITGILFGFITGDTATGLQVGAFMTLLLLDYTPVGGVIGPNGTVSVFCALVLTYLGFTVYGAFFIGVLSGIVFRTLDKAYRAYMGRRMLASERAIRLRPEPSIWGFVVSGIALQFIITFIFLLAFCIIARFVVPHLTRPPEKVLLALRLSYFAVPWLGVMMAFKKFTFKVR